MNTSIASQARGPRFSFTISATERARWRTLATSAEKSWTAPMKTTPSAIQRREGPQPKSWQAMIGPAIGPAAAIALEVLPEQEEALGRNEVDPSFTCTAGVLALSSSAYCRAMSFP